MTGIKLFDGMYGGLEQVLDLRSRQHALTAANLSNADTPGYKARDLDFKSIFKQHMPSEVNLERTQSGHMTPPQQILGARLMYRNPNQASLDGNTVETHVEQAKFAENAVQYQVSLSFINNKLSGLMTALRGE